jgi:ribosomal protein L32E
MAEGLRRLHIEKVHNLYYSRNTIRLIKHRRIRWARNVARMRQTENEYVYLVGKSEWRRPRGRSKHRRDGEINTDTKEIG